MADAKQEDFTARRWVSHVVPRGAFALDIFRECCVRVSLLVPFAF